MNNEIQCYYLGDWINIEKINHYFIKETDNGFINIKFYPLKINKEALYKIIFYSEDTYKIHDINQCIIDIPRYMGYIRKGDIHKFNLGDYTYESLMIILNKYYNKENIRNILNFIPQQIFYIIIKEIIDSWKDCIITKAEHQLNIDYDYVERVLSGEIYNNKGESLEKFKAKLRLNYEDTFVTLVINYYE